MSKTTRILLLTLLLWGGAFLFGLKATSIAHEGEQQVNIAQDIAQQDNNSQTPEDYQYSTPAGCSLSLLTRRSLQLYDQSDTSLTLSEPQIIYAETNIVKRLGRRLLNINEKVTIDKSVVEEFAKKSQGLSAGSITAWEQYAKRANFNLDYINPIDSASNPEKPVSDKKDDDNDKKDRDDQSLTPNQEGQPEDENKLGQVPPEEVKNDDQDRFYRWLISLAGVALIYYVFVNRRSP